MADGTGKVQLHTGDDSQQPVCDARHAYSAGGYKPGHLSCLVGIYWREHAHVNIINVLKYYINI